MHKPALQDIEDEALPLVLQQVSEALGIAVACKLAMDFGGREIYIPARIGDKHPLVKSLGLATADKLIRVLGPGAIEIPLGPSTFDARLAAAIRQRLERGQSEAQIARALHIHIRTVRRHRAKMREEGQPRLFD